MVLFVFYPFNILKLITFSDGSVNNLSKETRLFLCRLTKSGAYEGVVKVNVKQPNRNSEGDSNNGPSKRESSHEYD